MQPLMLARRPPPRPAGATRDLKGAGLRGQRERQSGGPARWAVLATALTAEAPRDAERKGHPT